MKNKARNRKRSGFLSHWETLIALNVGIVGASAVGLLLLNMMRQQFPHPAQAPALIRVALILFVLLVCLISFFIFGGLAVWCMELIERRHEQTEKKPDEKN